MTDPEIVFRWSDCDAAGVVYYPRIVERLHEALEAWFAARGVRFSECVREGLGLPTVSFSIEFLAPCRMGDVCRARITPQRLGRTSMTFALELLDAAGAVRARATQVLVSVSRAENRPQPVPGAIASLFRASDGKL